MGKLKLEELKLKTLQEEYDDLLHEEVAMFERHILGKVKPYEQVNESREMNDKINRAKKELEEQKIKVGQLKGDIMSDEEIDTLFCDCKSCDGDFDDVIDNLAELLAR